MEIGQIPQTYRYKNKKAQCSREKETHEREQVLCMTERLDIGHPNIEEKHPSIEEKMQKN